MYLNIFQSIGSYTPFVVLSQGMQHAHVANTISPIYLSSEICISFLLFLVYIRAVSLSNITAHQMPLTNHSSSTLDSFGLCFKSIPSNTVKYNPSPSETPPPKIQQQTLNMLFSIYNGKKEFKAAAAVLAKNCSGMRHDVRSA